MKPHMVIGSRRTINILAHDENITCEVYCFNFEKDFGVTLFSTLFINDAGASPTQHSSSVFTPTTFDDDSSHRETAGMPKKI